MNTNAIVRWFRYLSFAPYCHLFHASTSECVRHFHCFYCAEPYSSHVIINVCVCAHTALERTWVTTNTSRIDDIGRKYSVKKCQRLYSLSVNTPHTNEPTHKKKRVIATQSQCTCNCKCCNFRKSVAYIKSIIFEKRKEKQRNSTQNKVCHVINFFT